MSSNKLYKNCLHCDKKLVQTQMGRKKIYCNKQHREAFHREARKNMDRLEIQLDDIEQHLDDLVSLGEPIGPVMTQLPSSAKYKIKHGIEMRVVKV